MHNMRILFYYLVFCTGCISRSSSVFCVWCCNFVSTFFFPTSIFSHVMHIKNYFIPSGAIGSTLNAYIFNYPACEWHLEWKLDCICLFFTAISKLGKRTDSSGWNTDMSVFPANWFRYSIYFKYYTHYYCFWCR